MRSLRDLQEGEHGIIARIRGKGEFRKRIIEMGFIRGKKVSVIKAAPLQDPVEYKILDSNVSLRLEEAALIDVVTEDEALQFNGLRHFDWLEKAVDLNIPVSGKTDHLEVALVGNPNSGKTSLFNHASHSREHVGNYAGVTVDSKTARVRINGETMLLTDLPGTYSLSYYSPEELFVREYLTKSSPDVVINVVDASNIERNLYLTAQLIEMEVSLVVALNMYDEMLIRGDEFDFATLGKMTGITFMPTVASRGKGIKDLFSRVLEVSGQGKTHGRKVKIDYGPEYELAITRIIQMMPEEAVKITAYPLRFLAIKLLEKDKQTLSMLEKQVLFKPVVDLAEQEIQRLETIYREDTENYIASARYGFIEGALKETYKPGSIQKKTLTQRIDHFLTGKYMGYPIFIFFMWIMFQSTFWIGDYPVYLVELFVGWIGNMFDRIIPEGIINDLVIDGIIGGVGGVIVFLPNILILFIFISLMEDTGYMARVAFIVDKLMHKVGLHGKSFIPLLMGFGCNVPAIMATRTIENKNDRMVTMLIIPFMSCSARYPVYVLIISAFFTQYQGTILFLLYLIGIGMAALVALLLKKTLFKAKEFPFVMELPPYRMPTVKAIAKHTWFKGYQYLKKMGTVILVASIIIWALGYFPRNQQLIKDYERLAARAETEQEALNLQAELDRKLQERSYIGRLGHFIEPVIRPLGFDWRMGVSLIAGSAAKEVVVSTMGVLYQAEDTKDVSRLPERLKAQVYTSGPKEGQSVYTPLVAFSFMIFILIYFPCIAVIAAIKKESGKWRWSAFLAVYTTVLAWLAAFAVYQIGSLF